MSFSELFVTHRIQKRISRSDDLYRRLETHILRIIEFGIKSAFCVHYITNDQLFPAWSPDTPEIRMC